MTAVKPDDWREAILKEAAGGPKAKQVADRLPAYMQPGPKARRSPSGWKKRKARRKMARASRRRNRQRK